MMFNYVRPGGVLRDLPAGTDEKIRAWLAVADTYLDENDALLGRQRDLPDADAGHRRHRRRHARSPSG